MPPTPIESPDDPALETLAHALAARADALDASGAWPFEQLAACWRAGAGRWFVPRAYGGLEWTDRDIVRAYISLGGACLSTAFLVTQPAGVARRVAECDNEPLKERLLPALAAGTAFASVGISHLTTSRQHVDRPLMRARLTADRLTLDGTIPWVSGARAARWIVTGAALDDGRQVLVVLPTDVPGVEVPEPARMVALTATQTGEVHCRGVELDRSWLLAGPVERVLQQARGAGTGGLHTSALALGLSRAALGFIDAEAARRPDLRGIHATLQTEYAEALGQLLLMARGEGSWPADPMRQRANSLVLRATQAALIVAKGAGFLDGHPTGRWCREALFFLVWSCPKPVADAALCELAGLSS